MRALIARSKMVKPRCWSACRRGCHTRQLHPGSSGRPARDTAIALSLEVQHGSCRVHAKSAATASSGSGARKLRRSSGPWSSWHTCSGGGGGSGLPLTPSCLPEDPPGRPPSNGECQDRCSGMSQCTGQTKTRLQNVRLVTVSSDKYLSILSQFSHICVEIHM